MAWQSLIVGVLVVACAVYAAWSLMPAALRRRLATRLLKLPLPAAMTGPFQRAAKAASGCGCDGCDQAAVKPRGAGSAPPASTLPSTPQTITFHRRTRR